MHRSYVDRGATLARAASIAALGSALGGPGCSGTTGPQDVVGGSKDENGGGPLVPWRTAQARLSEDGSVFAAVKIGSPDVRVATLAGTLRGVTLQHPLAETGCSQFPVALASGGDVNGDGQYDLFVVDPGCGNWVAMSEAMSEGVSFRPQAWPSDIPSLAPRHYLESLELDADAHLQITSATFDGFQAVRLGDGKVREMRFPSPPQMNHMFASTLFLGTQEPGRWLFQRGGPFSVIEVTGADLREAGMLHQAELELLKPFEGFDQLSSLALAECSDVGVGVGVFTMHPEVPRRLNLLQVTANGYTAPEITTKGHQVFLVATARVAQTWHVGVLSGTADRFHVEVFEHAECGGLAPLATKDVAPLPEFTASPDLGQLGIQAGEKLLAFESGGRFVMQYVHDDVVRRWRLVRSAIGAKIESEELELAGGSHQ